MNTRLEWSLPVEHGSEVTQYLIQIQTKIGTFEESPICDGSTLSVVSNRACEVAYVHLRQSPYNLELGDDIVFEVKATNAVGWGPYSSLNTVKDLVRTEPLSPLTQVTEGALTDDSQVHIEWLAVDVPETGHDIVTSY